MMVDSTRLMSVTSLSTSLLLPRDVVCGRATTTFCVSLHVAGGIQRSSTFECSRALQSRTCMKLLRRRFLQLGTAAAALPMVSRVALARNYPVRPVRIIVTVAAGGVIDIAARRVGQWLSERLGQPFIVENRPGAAGTIGTEAVVRAPADGHTLLAVSAANTTSAALYDKLNFDFIRDIAPVAAISREPQIMLVNPSVPAKTVPEFVAYAKANPGKINFASAGIGTLTHVIAELFKIMAGVDMVHVPYRGTAPALNDLVAGQIQVTFASVPSSIEYIKAGNSRALAITTATRSDVLPDVPAVGDFLPGYEASAWFGLGAPRNTPAEIVDALNKEINAALADPRIKAQFADLGSMVLLGSPADFGKLIAEETEKWGKVIRTANIKAG